MAEHGTHNVNLRIPISIHHALRGFASAQERSVTWLINKILAEAVAKQEGAKK